MTELLDGLGEIETCFGFGLRHNQLDLLQCTRHSALSFHVRSTRAALVHLQNQSQIPETMWTPL